MNIRWLNPRGLISKASVLWHSAFFMVQLSHPYITTGRTIAFTIWTFVGKVMSLFYNILSRFVISFLPRSKRLLVSWLQLPSTVILEPKKIKVCAVSTVSPFTVTTRHIHNWASFHFSSASSFLLDLFLHSSPIAYWAPTDLGSSSFSVLSVFSCYSWGSQGKNTEVVCSCLLQWTTFCPYSQPWPICTGWPYTAWLIVSLS